MQLIEELRDHLELENMFRGESISVDAGDGIGHNSKAEFVTKCWVCVTVSLDGRIALE